jgi:23S rRNA G2445 N2-methylase RlmL
MKDINKKYGTKLKTHEDLINFGDFMENIRDFASDRIYDSDFAVDLYSEGEKLSEAKLLKLYKEFLKTGSRNIEKLKSNIVKSEKAKKRKRKVGKRKRRR